MGEAFRVQRLGSSDLPLMRGMNRVFADAFEDQESYAAEPPTDTYLSNLLAKDHVVALAAVSNGEVIGGLVAYEFDKFERARRELYIYDLAVAAAYRRRGLATGLIESVRSIAVARGAWVIFVQADHRDDPAIALYDKLGEREEVLHFDIAPE